MKKYGIKLMCEHTFSCMAIYANMYAIDWLQTKLYTRILVALFQRLRIFTEG